MRAERNAGSVLLTIPRLAGARGTATALAAALPSTLAGVTVVIEAAGNISAAQGFVDELCHQLMGIRSADVVEVRGASTRFERDACRSVVIRDYPDITFTV